MCLELMREMMRDVRICCFIEGCNEFAFFFSVLFCAAFYIGKGYRLFCFYFSNKFFYYSCTIVFFFFFELVGLVFHTRLA